MSKVTPRLKVVIAILSLLLTFFVWQRGLEESFNRPSVTPKLLINQREMALLAEPVLPNTFKEVLVGSNPKLALQEALSEIPLDQIQDRERLLLASLEDTIGKRQDLLEKFEYEPKYKLLKSILSKNFIDNQGLEDSFQELKLANLDQLLYQRSCLVIGGTEERCIDLEFSKTIAFRLIGSQILPSVAIFVGIGLIIRQCWCLFRKRNSSS